jgi:hypothetical protein
VFRSLQSTNNKQLIVINNCGKRFSSLAFHDFFPLLLLFSCFVLRVYINAYRSYLLWSFLAAAIFSDFSLVSDETKKVSVSGCGACEAFVSGFHHAEYSSAPVLDGKPGEEKQFISQIEHMSRAD